MKTANRVVPKPYQVNPHSMFGGWMEAKHTWKHQPVVALLQLVRLSADFEPPTVVPIEIWNNRKSCWLIAPWHPHWHNYIWWCPKFCWSFSEHLKPCTRAEWPSTVISFDVAILNWQSLLRKLLLGLSKSGQRSASLKPPAGSHFRSILEMMVYKN